MKKPNNFIEALEIYLQLDPNISELGEKYLNKFNRDFDSTESIMYKFEKWYFLQMWNQKNEYIFKRKIIDYYNKYKHYYDDSELIRQFLTASDDVRIISTVISVLGKCGNIDDIDSIKKFVNFNDERVCANAVEAIGNICFNHR